MTVQDTDVGEGKQYSDEAVRDRKTSHGVEVVTGLAVETKELGREIQGAMTRLNERAVVADLLLAPVQVLSSSYVLPNGLGYVTVIVMCQWMEREKLEAMQRQQNLMPGPRRGA